jgi:hypothetical protein
MNYPKPSISIPVDLTNPGQFFACCGLLELADRLWPGAEGWFDDTRFSITSTDSACGIAPLLRAFAAAEVDLIDAADTAASPLRLRLSNAKPMRLDWWQDVDTRGKYLKTWAGRQSGPQIFKLMKCAAGNASSEVPLNYSDTVFDTAGGKAKKKTLSPFYFDARRMGNTLDAGFSADEQQMSVREFPAVEALALVGLQRFRPFEDPSRPRYFTYRVWRQPLAPLVASSAISGSVDIPEVQHFRFSKPSRGGEYAYMFTRAVRERRSDV